MGELLENIRSGIMSSLQPCRKVELLKLCDDLELPEALDDPSLTKREYIESRLGKLEGDPALIQSVAIKFTQQYPVSEGYEDTFRIEECLWSASDYPAISKRARREIADRLEGMALWVEPDGFLNAVSRLWVLETPAERGLRKFSIGNELGSLRQQIQLHMIQNPGSWSVLEFFKQLGALDCSDKRFGTFIEYLAGSEVRPEQSSQRTFADTINKVLSSQGLELAESGEDGGYPSYALQRVGTGATGRPKNLIFASSVKPDLRFRDAVNNDIEIVSDADRVLVYDRPIPDTGLRWIDLEDWWAESNGYEDREVAKGTLYTRLLESLPKNSPPQRLLFKSFYCHFKEAIPGLPALLPEVWLHYDPKTIRQRGRDALFRQRMDFLLLISPSTRVVVEVDGIQHYSKSSGHADAVSYARMVAGDRELRLCGYDVYRFGGSELSSTKGSIELLRKFFDDLFSKYNISY